MVLRVLFGLGLGFLLVACAQTSPATPTSAEVSTRPEQTLVDDEVTAVPPFPLPITTDPARYAEYEMVTLLPRDAIPAIDEPQFLTAVVADQVYDPDELVIGIDLEGEARAYSVPLLSNHEIVNDSVGSRKIAITW